MIQHRLLCASIAFGMVAAAGQIQPACAQGLEPAFAQVRAAAEPIVRYDGHSVIRVNIRSARELRIVLALTDDVWSHQVGVGGNVDIRVSPEQLAAVVEAGLDWEFFIPDLQARIDEERAEIERRRLMDSPWFENYHEWADIRTYVQGLANQFPHLATYEVIGQSLEGRDIFALRITGTGAGTPPAQRPIFFFNGCQHAREWVSPATVVYIADRMLRDYATDPRVQNLMDNVEFVVVPVVNPDGYIFSWTNDRMWRKNRAVNAGSTCRGVDPNRNWGFEWGGQGASTAPCNQTFRGPAPFSEPETQVVRDYISANPRIMTAIDFHSYSELILSPWGYTSELPTEHVRFDLLNRIMQNSIASVHGRVYAAGPSFTTIYPASGVMPDWTYGAKGVLGFTIELRDTGQFGFILPPDQIIPTSEENLEGVYSFAEYLLPRTIEGACCLPAGCIVTGQAQCIGADGVYVGDGTGCSVSSCIQVLTTAAPNTALTSSNRGGVFLDLSPTPSPEDHGVSVLRFDTFFNNSAGTPVEFEIWTYPGTYVGRDTNPAGWVLHETIATTANGPSIATPLVLTNPIEIDAGETTGVYILAQSGFLRYTNQGAQPAWSNSTLSLFSDRTRSQPWGGSLFTVRTFSGSVYYNVIGGACYANCDGSTFEPVLNVDDFTCFINEFAQALTLPASQQISHYANCDGSTNEPVLNVDDFTCFINAFAAGCP